MSIAAIDIWIVYGLLFIALYFEVFLLASFIERRFRAQRPSLVKNPILPRVAIIVPSFNEEKTLASTVRSLQALDYPQDLLEIIIVDDGSRDNTLSIARTFETDPRIRVFHKENGGKHTAMNFGLTMTSADLIGCLDADSVVEPGALREIVAVFADKKIAAATPGIHVKKPDTMLQHMQLVEYRLSLFNRFALSSLGSTFITPGPFSLFRASVIRELGEWKHGHSTEDMEMALRMQRAGHLIANVPAAVVHTGTPRTLKALFHQRVRWTYGWLRNASDYRDMFGNGKFGNLGILILPAAMISIFAGIYFFVRVVFFAVRWVYITVERAYITGIVPHFSFDLFYVNTSALLFLIALSILLIVALLSAGTIIGTKGRVLPPKATPIFLLFYSFLVPLWLGAAVYRAALRTGVRWR